MHYNSKNMNVSRTPPPRGVTPPPRGVTPPPREFSGPNHEATHLPPTLTLKRGPMRPNPTARPPSAAAAQPPHRKPTLAEEREELKRQMLDVKALQSPLATVENAVDALANKFAGFKTDLRTNMVVWSSLKHAVDQSLSELERQTRLARHA